MKHTFIPNIPGVPVPTIHTVHTDPTVSQRRETDMRVEAVTNVVTEQTPDPRWPWVITAAQLQRMTFPEAAAP